MAEWRPVVGFPGYEVSDLGEVRSYRVNGVRSELRAEPRLLTPSITRGYQVLSLCRDGATFTRRVHHLVLEAFVGPRPQGTECCHGNGQRADNRLENLRWDTKTNNAADRDHHGTTAIGSRHGLAKLTSEEVAQIRAQRGFLSLDHLAALFGVTKSTVSSVHRGKTRIAA